MPALSGATPSHLSEAVMPRFPLAPPSSPPPSNIGSAWPSVSGSPPLPLPGVGGVTTAGSGFPPASTDVVAANSGFPPAPRGIVPTDNGFPAGL